MQKKYRLINLENRYFSKFIYLIHLIHLLYLIYLIYLIHLIQGFDIVIVFDSRVIKGTNVHFRNSDVAADII